jgi:hypothetical protein
MLYQGAWLFMQFILQLLHISSQWLRTTELKVTTGKSIRNFRTCPCCKKKGVDSADLAQGSRCLHCGKIIEVDFFYAVSFPILLAACLTAAFSYDYHIIGLIITGILLVHAFGVESINPRFFPLKSYEE